MTSPAPTIAFFGATGGCANACLTNTLLAGFNATALARTPSKLTDQLLAQGVNQATIDRQLTIIKGDATDTTAVKDTILPKKDGILVSTIVSGIGGTGRLQKSFCEPIAFDNPNICNESATAIRAALQEIYKENAEYKSTKPLFAVISTTGIAKKEDVPFGFRTFYHKGLAIPHEDKRKMEAALLSHMSQPEEDRVFRAFISVRPSLLTGDNSIKTGKGWETLRVGTEENPAVGYTIQRADVGQWIFEEVIRRGGDSWFGKMVTLTS
ncbi:hypothetical protein FQN54_004234 [Arachnomyces sp. PD_36]|nr:hypothetical protein FQN54_004234 [Arachnomyces sp. PD_36]